MSGFGVNQSTCTIAPYSFKSMRRVKSACLLRNSYHGVCSSVSTWVFTLCQTQFLASVLCDQMPAPIYSLLKFIWLLIWGSWFKTLHISCVHYYISNSIFVINSSLKSMRQWQMSNSCNFCCCMLSVEKQATLHYIHSLCGNKGFKKTCLWSQLQVSWWWISH